MAPSKVQQYVGELFRLCLCRNDDVKLACSTIQKPVIKGSKILTDLNSREQERIARENEILKELTLVTQKTFDLVESNTKKMVKKMLKLILQEQSSLLMQGPSYL